AVVEAWNGDGWTLLVPEGGYPGDVRIDRSGAATPAFIDRSGTWVESRFDLSSFLGRSLRLRFRVILDNGTPRTAPGWYRDKIRVTALTPCRRARLTIDRDTYGCGPTFARVLLADSDLDTDSGSTQSVQVHVTSGGGSADPLLVETASNSGLFAGFVGLVPAGGPAQAG